jgi:hypothetical protein
MRSPKAQPSADIATLTNQPAECNAGLYVGLQLGEYGGEEYKIKGAVSEETEQSLNQPHSHDSLARSSPRTSGTLGTGDTGPWQ